MLSEDQFSGLVQAIYDAPLDAAGWSPVVAGLTRHFRGSTACFVRQDMRTLAGVAATHGTDPHFHDSYFRYYAQRNVLWRTVRRLAPGSLFTEHDVLGKDAFLKSEFYNDWLRPQDVYATLACKLAEEGDTVTVVSVQRPHRFGDFDGEDLHLLGRLVPHLQRAARMETRLASEAAACDSSAGALDLLAHGVILLDADGIVCFANRRAEEILSANDGLTVVRRHLAASCAQETAPLRKLVFEAAQRGGTGGAFRVTRPDARRALDLLVMPLSQKSSPWGPSPTAQVAILVTDPERTALPSCRLLRDAYGLTRAEAAVTLELLRGADAAAAAESLGLALPTVRTHLRNVFRKTGTSRQADLVRLLAQGFPIRGDQ